MNKYWEIAISLKVLVRNEEKRDKSSLLSMDSQGRQR